jgi:uncharacterized membrane protein YfcA
MRGLSAGSIDLEWLRAGDCRYSAAPRRPDAIAMDRQSLLLAAVPVTGFVAGFLNTLAGSGSLLTLPLLILLGLPANVANGTNRVGVMLQNIVAVATFRRRGALPLAGSWKLIVPCILGAIVGAELAVDLDETLLRRTISVLMIVLLVVMLLKPERWIAAQAAPREPRLTVEIPLFFAIGVYGGFIQVSVGLFLIAALVLGAGQPLVAANALKNLIVLLFTAAALAVFVANGQVEWLLGLLLGAGQAAGAWVAAHFAVERGVQFVRWAVMVVTAGSAVALFVGAGL